MPKRAATESLLPLRAPKQPRISRLGMSTDGPTASQKEGTLARWVAASVKLFERGFDFLADYVENALQNDATQNSHAQHDPSRSRSDAARRATRSARREERDMQRTWSAPRRETRQPTAGPSTMRPNLPPSAPISPATLTSALPAQQRRRSASIKSQRDLTPPLSSETPTVSLPPPHRRRSQNRVTTRELPPPSEEGRLPLKHKRSLSHPAPDSEEQRDPTPPPATQKLPLKHKRSLTHSAKEGEHERSSSSGAGFPSSTPKQNKISHRSTSSRSKIPQEFMAAGQSEPPPATPGPYEQIFMGPPNAKQSYLRSMAPPPSPHQPPVKTPRPNPPTRSATLAEMPPPSLTTSATASTSSVSPSLPRLSMMPPSSLLTFAQNDLEDALVSRGIRPHRPVPQKKRKHIFDGAHKVKVIETRKMDMLEMEEALFAEARLNGFKSDFSSFRSRLKYQELLEGRGILSPSHSMVDIRDAARREENRRRSVGDEPSREFLERAFERVRATLNSPKPPQPWTPSLEQLRISTLKLDDAIEQRIRPKLPETLPPEVEADVDRQFTKRGTVAKFAREQVTDRDVARLRPNQWLNDEIINFYGQLLLARSEAAVQAATKTRALNGVNGANGHAKKVLDVHYFSTFFWSKLTGEGYERGRLAKWTKRFDIFAKDMLLIPVNHNNMHWTGAAINFRRKRIESYDSMGAKNKHVFQMLRSYLNDEHKNKKKTPFDFTDWVDYTLPDTPQQENGYDCGVFTCQFLETLSRGEETFNFSQKNIKYLRRRMAWEIAHTQLRDEH